jgi:hypothetical protein
MHVMHVTVDEAAVLPSTFVEDDDADSSAADDSDWRCDRANWAGVEKVNIPLPEDADEESV